MHTNRISKLLPGVLPEDLLCDNTIKDMLVGTAVYVVPWAMMVDNERRCFLNGTYSTQDTPSGTTKMRIERHEDGYHVFARAIDEKWRPSDIIPWVGCSEEDLVPVEEVH